MADARVVVDFLANTRGLQTGVAAAKQATGGLNKRMASTAAVAAAGAVSVAALAFAIRTGVNEYEQGAKVAAQTNAVIKSTGGVANVTAGHVDQLATSIMKKTGRDDEAVKSGENLLLTFTNIRNEAGKGNDIFDQATKATVDLSQAFGKDLNSSAVLVGKALNDPIKGITALTRVGVTFTKGQRDQIKAMVDAGDTMGAQKLILKELQREVGGSAEAYGKTLPGQVDIAKQSFNNLAGQLVGTVMPAVQKVFGFFIAHPDLFQALIFGALGLAAAIAVLNAAMAVTAALEAGILWPITLIVLAIVGLIAIGILLYKNWDKITAALRQAWADIVNAFNSAIAQIKTAMTSVVAALDAAWTLVKSGVVAAKDYIGKVISQIPGKITGAIAAITSAAARIGGTIVDGIKKGVIAAKDWVGTVVGQIVGKITGAIAGITSAAAGIGGAIVDGIKKGVVAAKDWVGDVAGQIPGKINGAITAIQTAANKIGSAIASGIKNGVEAAINWVGSKISGIAGKLADLLKKIPGASAVSHALGRSATGVAGVPLMARGGVVSRPTLMIAGEAGREIVAPEALLREIVGQSGSYTLNLHVRSADAQDIAYGFRRLELLRTGR